MFKQKNYLALGAVVLVVVLIFSLPPHATDRLKLALGSLFLPLLGLAGTAQQLPVDRGRRRAARAANCSSRLKISAAKTTG